MANTKLYVAIETFFTNVDGQPETIPAGTYHVTADSDLYKRFPDKFREVQGRGRAVEQATAAPGEVRQVEIVADDEPMEEDAPTQKIQRK